MPLYRATLNARYLGFTHQNVIHFKDLTGQGGVPVSCQFIAQDLAANWIIHERQLHQQQFIWNSIAVSEIRNPAPMPSHVEPVALAGTGITQSHSVSAIKVKWLTDRGGRRGFGKYYIGGINWALIGNNNSLSVTATDVLLGALAAWESRYMVIDSSPVPFSLVLVHKDPNDPPTDIKTATWYPTLGVQRRRNAGVGI